MLPSEFEETRSAFPTPIATPLSTFPSEFEETRSAFPAPIATPLSTFPSEFEETRSSFPAPYTPHPQMESASPPSNGIGRLSMLRHYLTTPTAYNPESPMRDLYPPLQDHVTQRWNETGRVTKKTKRGKKRRHQRH